MELLLKLTEKFQFISLGSVGFHTTRVLKSLKS